jgi:iron complex transport system substrate-binding protein
MVEIMSRKTIVAVIILIIVGVTAVIGFSQLYKPEEGPTGPVSVIDDVGRNVTITNFPPQRIVSMAASCTEILYALGLGDKVVGVDEYSDYPPEVLERVEAGTLTTVGSFAEINIELVVSLEPDLIVATGGVQRAVVENLEGQGQPVLVLYPERFDGVLTDISLVGEITGQTDEAEEIVTDMQERAEEIAEKAKDLPKIPVYIEMFFNGGYWTFGSDSYVDELISMAGGTNVFSGVTGGHISTSSEEILQANPEIIIISRGAMADNCGLTPEVIRARPGWNEISAVKNDRIYEVSEPIIVLGVPRLIDGLEAIAEIIHPELFS